MRGILRHEPRRLPVVQGEMGISYKRRLRRARLQAKFARNMAEVDAGKKSHPADDALKGWLASGEASSTFRAHFVLPPMRANSKKTCEYTTQKPKLGVEEDSLWLRNAMGNPNPRGPAPLDRAPTGNNVAMGAPEILESVARETHIASLAKEEGRTEWKSDVLARLHGAPSNYGVSPKKKGDSRMSKLEVFGLDIQKSPYLCKKKDGRWRQDAPTRWNILRSVGINISDEILRSVAKKNGGGVVAIYGDWVAWGGGPGEKPPPARPKRFGAPTEPPRKPGG